MAETLLALGEDYPEIRAGVRKICEGFPGAYWRGLDERQDYPDAFVTALTEAGYLAALIPETYGGAGLPLRAASAILEEIHASGCNAAACHAQLYVMGTLLRHGSEAQKQAFLPKIASGELRLQAFGVTEPSTGTDTTQLKTRAERDGDHYVVTGKRSGPPVRCNPICCYCSRARRRPTRCSAAATGSPSSSSIFVPVSAKASRSSACRR
jgi:acyl-CoA dehydrogenase